MTQLKQTALRKIMLILVAVILVACMAVALVACNNSGKGGKGNGGNSGGESILNTIDSTEFNKALNGMIGYLYAHEAHADSGYHVPYANTTVIGNYKEDLVADEVINLRLRIMDDSMYASCIVLFYNTEQDAIDNLKAVKNNDEYKYDYITQIKSAIIIESEQNLYSSIKASQPPTNAETKSELKFFNDALKKTLNTNAGSVSFGSFSNRGLLVYSMPKQGNIYDLYFCSHWSEFVAGIEVYIDLNLHTSNSYMRETDGVYYCYLQPKPGFYFIKQPDETGYALLNYYYNSSTTTPSELVIPETYNNKPVVEIGYFDIPKETTAITIPASITVLDNHLFEEAENLTAITFNGTKAQWEEFDIDNEYMPYVNIIHCTDGDIYPNGGTTVSLSFFEALSYLRNGNVDSFLLGDDNITVFYFSNDMIFFAETMIAVLEGEWFYVIECSSTPKYYKYNAQEWDDYYDQFCSMFESESLRPLLSSLIVDEINVPHPAIPDEYSNYHELAVEKSMND